MSLAGNQLIPDEPLLGLPAPGLAIFPQYLSNTPLKVALRSDGHFSSSMTASVIGSKQALFTVDSATFSMSHRKQLIDAATNTPLYEIAKDGLTSKRYAAYIPGQGVTLWTTETHTRFMHRPRTAVTFANAADEKGGRPQVELEFVPAGAGKDGSFKLNGQDAAVVEKISMSLDGEYHLSIAPGMDPAIVVGVMVAMIDRAKTQSSAGAAGGAAAGAGGGGGGC